MRILFIANEKREADASRMYRCNNQAAQLSSFGWETNIVDQHNINFNLLKKSNIVVFQRCLLTKEILQAYKIAKKNNTLILTDFDDLIFLPDMMKDSGAVRSKVITNLKSTKETSLSRYSVIPLSDFTIVSTKELYKQINLIGGKAILSKNAINDFIQKKTVKANKGKLNKILYMSGTKTHNSDFMLCYKDLLKFLKKFNSVELTILGEVDVPNEMKELNNVFLYEKVKYEELFDFVSTHDISLVPLEDTIFNDAKSSLKFYESGYVSVPVIASPVKEFQHDIEDSVNGFLVKNNNWFETLEKIYTNESLLFNCKINCHRYVLKNYTVSGRKDSLSKTLYTLWNKKTDILKGETK